MQEKQVMKRINMEMEKSLKNYSQGLFSFPPRWCFLLAASLCKDLHVLVCMAFLLYIHFKSIFQLNVPCLCPASLCHQKAFFSPAHLGHFSAWLKLQVRKFRLDIRKKNLFYGSECRSTAIGHPRKWWRYHHEVVLRNKFNKDVLGIS